jgi:hypothetical protein
VVSLASMDIDPVWFSTLDELKEKRKKKMNTAPADLRKSVRIRKGMPTKNWRFRLVQRHPPLDKQDRRQPLEST